VGEELYLADPQIGVGKVGEDEPCDLSGSSGREEELGFGVLETAFADYQPIVDLQSGELFALEALPKGTKASGKSVPSSG
jgi:hypothetical protein